MQSTSDIKVYAAESASLGTRRQRIVSRMSVTVVKETIEGEEEEELFALECCISSSSYPWRSSTTYPDFQGRGSVLDIRPSQNQISARFAGTNMDTHHVLALSRTNKDVTLVHL
jgi:hypothetical protein